MSTMPDILNHIASSPSKRKKLHEVDHEELLDNSSSTGLDYQDDGGIAIGNETSRKRARSSRTTLSKPSDRTLQDVGRINRTFDVPNSPERIIEAARQKPKTLKNNNKKRLINRPRPQESPLKGTAHGAIDVIPEVRLNSHNTPARPGRSRGTRKGRNALNPLRLAPKQLENAQSDDQADGGEEPMEYGEPSAAEEPDNAIPDEPGPVGVGAHSAGKKRRSSRRTTQDRRSGDEQVRAPNNGVADDLPGDDALDAEIQRQHAPKRRRTRDERTVRSETRGTDVQIDEQVDEEGEERQSAAPPSQSQRKKGRRPQNEEERIARREAQAREWADNAAATERARLNLLEKRGRNFMDGIGDIIQRADIGSVELLSTLGAAGAEISAIVEKKMHMDTDRAEALNKTLRELTGIFMEDRGDNDGRIDTLMSDLKKRVSRAHLKGDEGPTLGDPTVVNLFEHLIPQSIRLIRQYLRNHFYEQDKQSWTELRTLVKAARTMSNIALAWDPKPSVLETGIRGNVYNKIRPNLTTILEQVTKRAQEIEAAEEFELTRREAERAQIVVHRQRNQLRSQWDDELEKRMSLIGRSTAKSNSTARESFHDEAIDIDDIEDNNFEKDVELYSRNSSMLAPWSEAENTALLNGLQKHQNGARFWLVRNEYPQLRGRAIDECIARALFYKGKLRQKGLVVEWLHDI